MSKPENLTTIWGTNGSISVPDNTKIELGWEAEIPPYEYFNYILNKHAQALNNINVFGMLEWDDGTFYVQGSHVIYLNREYRCDVPSSVGEVPITSENWTDVRDEVNVLVENIDDYLTAFAKLGTDVSFTSLVSSGNISSEYGSADSITADGITISDQLANYITFSLGYQETFTVPKGMWLLQSPQYPPYYDYHTVFEYSMRPLGGLIISDGTAYFEGSQSGTFTGTVRLYKMS